jgi:myo-inositol catabolism protein IolC
VIQVSADKEDGYIIAGGIIELIAVRDAINHAIDHGLWVGASIGVDGVTPWRVEVRDTPITVGELRNERD